MSPLDQVNSNHKFKPNQPDHNEDAINIKSH